MQSANASQLTTDIAVIGGGAAGIGVIASLLKRSPGLRISLVEPADTHYYQPGWTLVGGGAYAQGDTARPMAALVPAGVEWLRTRVERVEPGERRLLLENGGSLEYRNLIVCPGLRLAWERIEGLEESLGRNGVTSNYRYDLAPYTWGWCADCVVARRCSPSRRCRSSAPGRRRRPCTCPATTGCGRACCVTSRSSSTWPARRCSASPTSSRR